MSQEGIIVCAWPVSLYCSVPHLFNPVLHNKMHMFTHTSATEPLLITRVSWDLYRETLAHIGCQCGVSLSLSESHVCVIFICTVKAAFIIYLVFLSVQNGAQLFPPQLIWNSNKHNISLRSMKYVAILSRLSSDFEIKDKTTKK